MVTKIHTLKVLWQRNVMANFQVFESDIRELLAIKCWVPPRISYRIIRKGGENHLAPSTYQETVPITNVLIARMHLWENSRCF